MLQNVAFTLTGVACALPGALLPVLFLQWDWSDRRAGWFFLLIAAGLALGPFLLPRKRNSGIALGFGLTGFAALSWCLSWYPLVFALLWGLGLGAAMTGISLEVSAKGGRTSLGLMRINLLWSLGAFLAPLAVASALHTGSQRVVLSCLASICCILSIGFLSKLDSRQTAHDGPDQSFRGPFSIPLFLTLATVLSPAVEAATGAWLATFADRSFHAFRFTLAAPACFWAGLLLSRIWRSLARHQVLENARGIKAHLVFTFLGAVGLLFVYSSGGTLSCSFLLGLGLGPLYPHFLSRILTRGGGRSIFFLVGVGVALSPWATGQVSYYLHSLRMGFLVPVVAAAMLLRCGWVSVCQATDIRELDTG
jgi:hypothetical protein